MGGPKTIEDYFMCGRPKEFRGQKGVGGPRRVGGPTSVEAKGWEARVLRPDKCRGQKGVAGQTSVEAQHVGG